MKIIQWETFKEANDPVQITLRASEWMYVRDYLVFCHDHVGVPCASQMMHNSVKSLDAAVATYNQDRLFDASQNGEG
jgi:hypothetical protein